MTILRRVDQAWMHDCPGCNRAHIIPDYGDARWSFNGNYESPTFQPSVCHRWTNRGDGGVDKCCHYFIRDGRIEFCGDCTHALAGQTVDLPSMKEPPVPIVTTPEASDDGQVIKANTSEEITKGGVK